jgi:hypothetical protein
LVLELHPSKLKVTAAAADRRWYEVKFRLNNLA